MNTRPGVALTLALFATPILAQPRDAAPMLVFHANDFWLNLHQFLYVLGRHDARMPDRTRRAVAGAPADVEKGFATLSGEEQRRWRDAVTFYANGPSKQDAVFDASLVKVGQALARASDSPSLAGMGVETSIARTLEQVGPVYRKAWWGSHHSANERWAAATQSLVDKHGRAMLGFISRAYQLSWPPAGYPIRVSAYANWAGAFSTEGNLLVMSSLDPGTEGLKGLEIAFHEAMHQWDEAIGAVLTREATRQNLAVPDLLSHAMIFYTAGEATRAAVPGHVPYAEANGLWRQRGLGALKPALDEVWKPYLSGNGTRDEAIAGVLARMKN